jgi:hypothetical protein
MNDMTKVEAVEVLVNERKTRMETVAYLQREMAQDKDAGKVVDDTDYRRTALKRDGDIATALTIAIEAMLR